MIDLLTWLITLSAVIVALGSILEQGAIERALQDQYPKEFTQDRHIRAIAIYEFVFLPWSPLAIQKQYLCVNLGFSYAVMAGALCCFLQDAPKPAFMLSAMSVVSVISMVRKWLKYRANRAQKLAEQNEIEQDALV